MRACVLVGVVSVLLLSGSAEAQTLEERFDALQKEFHEFKKQETKASSKSTLEKMNVSLSISGRLFSDWAFFDLDKNLDSTFDEEDGTEFRAVRIAASGTIDENFEFKVQTDFVGQDVDFKDVWIGVKGLPQRMKVRVGHLKEPFSLDQLTSARFMTFMERSVMDTLVPGRNTGLLVSGVCPEECITWAAGVFRDVGDSGAGSDNGKLSLTGRVTASPVYQDKGHTVVHVGLAYSHRNPNDTGKKFAAEPEAHITSDWVDTGLIMADRISLAGAEAAVVLGPFSAQAEYVYADVTRSGASDAKLMGYYGEISYFLTGERRNYSRKKGAFGRVKPKNNVFGGDEECGCGAWQLAARISNIDLQDSGVTGGELNNIAVGLNWYLNPNTRVMCNYINADLDDVGRGDIFQMRFQVDF